MIIMNNNWVKPKDYQGCKNCKYQPEPLQTCDWLKMQKSVVIICPKWELRGEAGMTNEKILVELDDLVELDLVELLEKRKPSCVNCRHADYKNNSTVYCLKHNCGMLSNTCCRNWEDENET